MKPIRFLDKIILDGRVFLQYEVRFQDQTLKNARWQIRPVADILFDFGARGARVCKPHHSANVGGVTGLIPW